MGFADSIAIIYPTPRGFRSLGAENINARYLPYDFWVGHKPVHTPVEIVLIPLLDTLDPLYQIFHFPALLLYRRVEIPKRDGQPEKT
tara:strand:- start:1530 stop:1790 length:261 start_codon:yes stop_codon:yes gene_type:complete